MKNLLHLSAGAVAILAASLIPLPAAHLTGLTLFGVNFARNELVTISPATGAGAIVGAFGDTTFATGLGVRDGRLFIFDQVDDRIREINKISGKLISSIDIGVGNLNGEGALAFRSSDGMGFLASPLNANNEPVNDLYMVTIVPDAATGVSVRIGSTVSSGGTPVAIDAMAFNSSGTLYAIGQADGTLYTINTTTAVATAVGPVAPLLDATGATVPKNSPIAGMTFGRPNPDMGGVEEIYASIDDRLYIVTPTTGAARLSPGPNVALNFGPFVSSIAGLGFSTGAGALANMSGRLAVGTGDNVGITGFIIRGTPSKKVVARGIGPSLPGLTGKLADPVLEMFNAQGVSIGRNDNFASNPDNEEQEIRDLGLAPSNPNEAALLRTLPQGAYTAIISGASGTSGLGLVELYDAEIGSSSQLVNLSTRGLVQTGDRVLIGGLIVQGSTPQRVVVRALGPTLAGSGVQNALADPTLEIFDSSGTSIKSNDNFANDPDAAEIMMRGLAPGQLEAATLLTLTPGAYTAIARGANNSTGVALIESYNITAAPSPTPAPVAR